MKRRKITLAIIGGDPVTITASVEPTGAFAIHRTPGSDDLAEKYYSVTHIRSGQAIVGWCARDRALEIATIAATCGADWDARPPQPGTDIDAWKTLKGLVNQ